jgi:hypothetical protein
LAGNGGRDPTLLASPGAENYSGCRAPHQSYVPAHDPGGLAVPVTLLATAEEVIEQESLLPAERCLFTKWFIRMMICYGLAL